MPDSLDDALAKSEALAKKAEKPGFLTSEFWMAAGTFAAGLLVRAGIVVEAGPIAATIGTIGMFAGPVVYILARSGLKKGLGEALAYVLAELTKKKDEPQS